MKLAITLATRGRPRQVVDTISRSVALWSLPDTEMWVMVDADDPATADALYAAQPRWHDAGRKVLIDVREREDTIAAKWNHVVDLCPLADVYLVVGDDDPFVTPSYDDKILAAAARFPDGIGMVYGHMANASFSGVVAPTRGFVERLGVLCPTYFPYWFWDHWTDDIARLIGRISFADVRTDQSGAGHTQEMREPGWWATWFDAAKCMRRHQAMDMIDFLAEPAWRKECLRAHYPLIEHRSKWINDSVRATSRHHDAHSGLSLVDARYQRVKQRAIEMIPHLLDDYGMDRMEAARYREALIPQPFIPALARLG